jgi:4-amino-4-deoxy-L-arabinose transferase-like glycosyltransferase
MVGTLSETRSASQQRTEIWLRRIFVAFLLVAGAAIVCHFGLLLWAENSFTGPETVVAGQSMMLARQGTLYYDLNRYPYTVCAYTPLFYLLEAGLFKLGLPAYVAGRLISFCAFFGILVLAWRLLILYTRDRDYAWLGVLLCGSSSLLLSWGTVAQVDTLAVFCALMAFYQYSRHAVLGDRTLVWAGVFCLLAFFTKQTMLACPAAISILLWRRRKQTALGFAIGTGVFALIAALSLNAALDGRFLSDTVLANLNPYSAEKLFQHLRYALLVGGPLLLVAAIGAKTALRTSVGALFVYLGTAIAVLAVTSPKVGSDLNYQIEFTSVLILCACVALHSLGFLTLLFSGSKRALTLLQLPLAVFLVVNDRVSIRNIFERFSGEQFARVQVEAVRPYLSAPGRVLSADYNALVRVRGQFDLEMLIYKLLVDAGVADPLPVQRDIAAGAFSAIVLFQDIEHDRSSLPVEISTLPPAQIEEIRRHYKLTRKIAGQAWDGVYVYQPVARVAN